VNRTGELTWEADVAIVHGPGPRTTSVSDATADGIPTPNARTLRVTAIFVLSETGRKASLLDGGDGRARQEITIEVPTHRLHLVSVDARGIARLKLRPYYQVAHDNQIVRVDNPPVYDRPPSVEELFLAAAKNHELERTYQTQRATSPRNQRRSAALQRRLQVAEAFLADPAQRALIHPPPAPTWCHIMTPQGRMLFDATRDAGPAKQVPAEAHRRFQSDERARRHRSLELRAQQKALHEEKKRFVAEWINANGTVEQKARQAAGVLPFGEAIEAIADHTFAPAREVPRYEHDGAARLQAHLKQFPQYGDVVITPSDLVTTDTESESATASQWASVLRIRSALPESIVTLRVHRLSWKRDMRALSLSLYGVLAVCTVGPLIMRREFAVEEPLAANASPTPSHPN
jgi:hypothetical protein